LAEAGGSLDVKDQRLACDTLSELPTPGPGAALRPLLRGIPFAPANCSRYLTPVLQRSMLTTDDLTFGELMHASQVQGRTSKGTTAQVKSGYDGVQRETAIFSRKTQCYVRRLAWRYLRTLAAHRPAAYPHAAAEALIHYTPEDTQDPQGLMGQ